MERLSVIFLMWRLWQWNSSPASAPWRQGCRWVRKDQWFIWGNVLLRKMAKQACTPGKKIVFSNLEAGFVMRERNLHKGRFPLGGILRTERHFPGDWEKVELLWTLCGILAGNDAPRAKFRLVENRLYRWKHGWRKRLACCGSHHWKTWRIMWEFR